MGTDPRPSPGQPPLRSIASRAFGWSFLNTIVTRFGTLAIGIALARLLGPEEFGSYAVALVALSAVLSFNELGVSLAIVRWPGDPREIAPTVTTISVVSSAILVIMMVLGAPGFASMMGDAGAAPVIQVMSLAVLVNGLVAVPAALMQREFQQGRRMVVDQVNTWLGAGCSLALAVSGMGAMSLALGRVIGASVSAVLFIRWSPLRFRLGLARDRIRPLLRFGLPLAGASLVVFAGSFADQLVVSTQLGATALGFYVLAFNLSSWPVSVFSQPLRSVAPAAFARLQSDTTEMSAAFEKIMGLLMSAALPVCALLAGAAAPIIQVVYGAPWAPASDILRWLATLAAFRIFFELTYDFLVVRGRSQAILVSQTVWLVAAVPALLVGSRLGGASGVAAASAAVAAGVLTPLFVILLRSSQVSVVGTARRLVLPLLGSGFVFAASMILSNAFSSPLAACAASGGLAVVVMAALGYRHRAEITTLRRSPEALVTSSG